MSELSHAFFEMLIHQLTNPVNGSKALAQVMMQGRNLNPEDIQEMGEDLSDSSSKSERLLNRFRVLINPNYYNTISDINTVARLKSIFSHLGILPPRLSAQVDDTYHGELKLASSLLDVLCESLLFVLLHKPDDSYIEFQEIKICPRSQPDNSIAFLCSNTSAYGALFQLNNSNKKHFSSHYEFELQTLFYLCEFYQLKFTTNCSKTNLSLIVTFPQAQKKQA